MEQKKRRKGRPSKDPRLVKVAACYKLPRWIIAWMTEQGKSRAGLIEAAIIAHYRISPPA